MSSPFSWHSEGMEPVNGAGFLRRITRLSVCRGDVPLPPRHALAPARPVSAAAHLSHRRSRRWQHSCCRPGPGSRVQSASTSRPERQPLRSPRPGRRTTGPRIPSASSVHVSARRLRADRAPRCPGRCPGCGRPADPAHHPRHGPAPGRCAGRPARPARRPRRPAR